MRLAWCLLSVASAFQLPLLPLQRADRSMLVAMADGEAEPVKITVRKRRGAEEPSASTVFVVSFSHVKPSLATFLKFWIIGGCGVEGWSSTGNSNDELEAQHSPSGTMASIKIDAEKATVSLVSPSAASSEGNNDLSQYASAVLDEMETLAKTEEAAEADRLCFPPDAVGPSRLVAWASCAPRAQAGPPAASAEPASGDTGKSDFGNFLDSLK